MAEADQFERLNQAIDALLARRDSQPRAPEDYLSALVEAAAEVRTMPREEFRRSLKAQIEEEAKMSTARTVQAVETGQRAQAPGPGVNPIREGFRTLTPYLIVKPAEELLHFVKQAFGAQELMRGTGGAGGMHAEVRLGDSIVMIGGGGEWSGALMPTSLWMYVEDVDAVYEEALRAGATKITPPADQPYGERGAAVTDAGGNQWYIATYKGESYIRPGMNNVNLYLHPTGAVGLVEFMERAFGAEVLEKHLEPSGRLAHAQIRIGNSVMGMGEAQGPYPDMPTAIYMYVPDVDAVYARSIAAGGKSLHPPMDQRYGDRNAGVEDGWGNQWYIATHIGDVAR